MLQSIITILFLVFLEGILSFDNALVLAVMANKLPKDQQKKALTYGMWGAMGFRFLALTVLQYLMQALWVKILGGIYLLYLASDHFLFKDEKEETHSGSSNFWKTILLIELTDISFSADSIFASVGVSDNFWIILVGGVLGIAFMRVASILFLKLIARFPGLEISAFSLIAIIGAKLTSEGIGLDWHTPGKQIFLWSSMIASLLFGFFPAK